MTSTYKQLFLYFIPKPFTVTVTFTHTPITANRRGPGSTHMTHITHMDKQTGNYV